MSETIGTNHQGGPTLTALPEVPEREILLGQVNQARAEHATALKALQEMTTHNDALKERLKEVEKNPLIFALAHMDAGEVLREAGEELKTVCEAVQRLGAKGSLTVKIEAKMMKGNDRALVLVPQIVAKTPKMEAPSAIFFRGEDGQLQRNDPKQRTMKLGDKRRGIVDDDDQD